MMISVSTPFPRRTVPALYFCLLLLAVPTHGFFAVNTPGSVGTRLKNRVARCFRKPLRASLSQAVPSGGATTNFWGTQRSRDEIIDYISWALDLDADTDKIEILSTEPPLVVIHDFISPKMCQEIMEAAIDSGNLERSTTGAEQEESTDRTSMTTWLKEDQCEEPLRVLAHRVSRLSGIPTSHMENLQVVRYFVGQEFAIHTDHLDSFNDLACRGRLATCLIYLQEPTGGGETRFFEFDANVPPEQGSAVFFWNTLERPGSQGYDPNMFLHSDERLRHAGLPVSEGEKWVCNRWIHPIDYGAGVRGLE